MGQDFIVRFASICDLDVLVPETYVSADVVRRKIECEEFLVAERVATVIGFVQLEYLWSKVPYIALIRVFSEHRHNGVGKGLLRELESQLCTNGHKILYSSSQADELEPQEWHRHVGFEKCGVIREVNDGIDEIFFRKVISEK